MASTYLKLPLAGDNLSEVGEHILPTADVTYSLGNSSLYFKGAFVGDTDSGTTTVLDALTLKRITSGTAAAGLGVGILLQLEDASGNLDTAAQLTARWLTATHGAEDAAVYLSFPTTGLGVLEQIKFYNAGTGPIIEPGATGGAPGTLGTVTNKWNLHTTSITGAVTHTGAATFTSTITAAGLIATDVGDAATATITDALRLSHSTSDTPAAGLGVGILLRVEDSVGTIEQAGRISAILTDVTSGSEDSVISFQVRAAGAALAESFRVTATQVLSLAGDGSAAAPTYSFTTYPGAGMLANTGGTLIAYGGNQIARFGSDDIQFNHGGASIWLFGATYFKPSTHMVGALGATDAYLNTGFIGCSDAGTTTTLDALTLRRDTSGTAAAGLGCGLLFRLEQNDANPGDAARVAAVWTDATFTTKDADIVFSAMKANTMTEGARVKGTGGIICPAGSTEALPSFGISTSGGMFEYSSNVIGFATGGTLRFRVAAAGITTSVALLPNTARTEAVGSSSAPMGPSFLGATDSGTTTTLDALTLSRSTSGTAGTALGCGLLYELEDAGGTMESAGRISTVWTDATNATEDSAITFQTKTAGAALAEAARLVGLQWRMSDGTVSLPSYSFTNYTSSGWYVNASGINVAYNGVSGGYWSADDVLFKMGTVSTHYFDGSSYQPSTDLLTTLGVGTKRFSAGYIASINSADGTKKFECNNTGVGFFAAAPIAKQTSGADLTNNVTAGGSDDTIADFTSLTVYSTDAAAIRNDIYQLARKLKQVNDALRDYGLLT